MSRQREKDAERRPFCCILAHGVAQGTDFFDGTLHNVPAFEEFGRVKAHAHARGGARCDDGAGEEGHAGGKLGDDVRKAPDEDIRGAIKAQH